MIIVAQLIIINLFKKKKRCINDCKNDNFYKFEYQNTCFEKCPPGSTPNENNICIIENSDSKCPDNSPYLIIGSNICTNECNAIDLFNNICKIDNPTTNDDEVNKIEDAIMNGFLSLTNGEDMKINGNNKTYLLTTTLNQNYDEYNDISTLKLGDCEKMLRNVYTIILVNINHY